jgi:hypothetical protein
MRSRPVHRATILACAAFCLSIPIDSEAQQAAQLDQRRLQAQLARGTPEERGEAIAGIMLIPPNQRSPATVSALISEADRLNTELEQRGAALSAGRSLEPVADEGEYLFAIQEALCQADDSRVIRPLAAQITGNRVINALADFGDAAVPELLKATSRDTSNTFMAVVALSRMLTRQVRVPLTTRSRELLTDLAAKLLTPPQDSTVLSRAAELAVALGDVGLHQRVEQLADDEAKVRSFGITDPTLIENVKTAASRALQRGRP